MNDLRTILVVFLLIDPHGLERRERGKDGAAEPYRVFTLWWGQDLNFIGRGRQLVKLLPHALTHALEQSGASRQDDILEQIPAHVIIALGDRVVAILVHSLQFVATVLRREQDLSTLKALVADQDLAAVRQLVVLLA